MNNYERGFLAKCAEYGIPENDAVALCKKAGLFGSSNSDFSKFQRNAANSALNQAYLGGYESFLPDELKVGSRNKPGTMLGRLFLGRDYVQRKIDEGLNQAREKYREIYGVLPSEDKDYGRNAMRAARNEARNYHNALRQFNEARKFLTNDQLKLLENRGVPFTGNLADGQIELLKRYGAIPDRRINRETFAPPPVYNPGTVNY